jgi:hypothetical protein
VDDAERLRIIIETCDNVAARLREEPPTPVAVIEDVERLRAETAANLAALDIANPS